VPAISITQPMVKIEKITNRWALLIYFTQIFNLFGAGEVWFLTGIPHDKMGYKRRGKQEEK
jgi:hypothetical protein